MISHKHKPGGGGFPSQGGRDMFPPCPSSCAHPVAVQKINKIKIKDTAHIHKYVTKHLICSLCSVWLIYLQESVYPCPCLCLTSVLYCLCLPLNLYHHLCPCQMLPMQLRSKTYIYNSQCCSQLLTDCKTNCYYICYTSNYIVKIETIIVKHAVVSVVGCNNQLQTWLQVWLCYMQSHLGHLVAFHLHPNRL